MYREAGEDEDRGKACMLTKHWPNACERGCFSPLFTSLMSSSCTIIRFCFSTGCRRTVSNTIEQSLILVDHNLEQPHSLYENTTTQKSPVSTGLPFQLLFACFLHFMNSHHPMSWSHISSKVCLLMQQRQALEFP